MSIFLNGILGFFGFALFDLILANYLAWGLGTSSSQWAVPGKQGTLQIQMQKTNCKNVLDKVAYWKHLQEWNSIVDLVISTCTWRLSVEKINLL